MVDQTDVEVQSMDASAPEPLDKRAQDENIKPSAKAPEGGYGWVVCFACFFINFLVDGLSNCFAVHLQEYRQYFRLSVGEVTLANSIMCSAYALSGPVVSMLVNKYGPRKVGLAGVLVASLGFLISAFSPNIFVFYLTYGLMAGMGIGMMHLPVITAVGQYFVKKHSFVMGIVSCGSSVGVFAVVPLASFLSEHFDWKGSHFIFAGLMLQGCVFYSLVTPLKVYDDTKNELLTHSDLLNEDTKKVATNHSHGLLSKSLGILTLNNGGAAYQRVYTSDFIISDDQPQKRVVMGWGSLYDIPDRAMLKQPPLSKSAELSSTGENVTKKRSLCPQLSKVCSWLGKTFDVTLLKKKKMLTLLFATLLGMVGYYIPIIFATNRAIDAGVNQRKAALLLSIFGISNTVGRFMFGTLTTFYQKLPTLIVHNVTIAIAGVAIALTPLCDTFPTMAISISVYGFFFATYVALGATIVRNTVGHDKLTSGYGLFLLTRGLGTILGPPIGGQLYDLTGNYDSTFYMSGGCMLTAVFIYSLLFKQNSRTV